MPIEIPQFALHVLLNKGCLLSSTSEESVAGEFVFARYFEAKLLSVTHPLDGGGGGDDD